MTRSELFETLAAEARVTVVTPNRRLAAYLKDEFDHAQLRAGRAAWASADILPIGTFFERSYRALNLRGGNEPQPQLLDAPQTQLLWEQVVNTSDVASHLLSVAQTAKQASAAWTLAQAWSLLLPMRNMALFEDAEVFRVWADQFRKICRERGFIDSAVLPTLMVASMEKGNALRKADWVEIFPKTLFTAGFDITTPQQQAFFTAARALGVTVTAAETLAPVAEATCQRFEFATAADEFAAVAAWSRQRLATEPKSRIAIVVPDLARDRADIARALTDALSPGQRASASLPPAGNPPFNISLGVSLASFALVHDALALIGLALSPGRRIAYLDISAALRSPFIAAAEVEMSARARLDAALREWLPPETNLFGIQRKLKLAGNLKLSAVAAECSALLGVIDRVVSVDNPAGNTSAARRPKPAPRDWSRYFGQVLQAWGFPGDGTLDSSDYQVLEKFRDALRSLATLESVQLSMRADEALTQLQRIVHDTVFQPKADAREASPVPIQVQGILESAGQAFDAIWVTGLDETAWPIAARANAFIPAVLQRAVGVTEASSAASLALDEAITARWQRSAKEVVFSHAKTPRGNAAGDQPRAASALTRPIALGEFSALVGSAHCFDYAAALFAIGQREAIPDLPFAALPTPVKVSGGASVITDFAACPFRAFARHRLGARPLNVPDAGLGAMERGIVLHRVLHIIWTTLGNHASLLAIDETSRVQLVNNAVSQAIKEAHDSGQEVLSGRFAELEQGRLACLAQRWLGYETERTPFTVVAGEQAREVTLAGLLMRLRLDRLDELADGTHALIDYKTGNVKLASWLGERPDEPQLPLYFLTANETISALAFARVKRGVRGKTFGFEGVSAAEDLLLDVGPIENKFGMEKKGYVSWDVLITEWETALTGIAQKFIAGDTTVDPKNGRPTCGQCDLQSVCRIAELQGRDITTDEDAE